MFDLSKKARRYKAESNGTMCVSNFRRTRFSTTGSISSATCAAGTASISPLSLIDSIFFSPFSSLGSDSFDVNSRIVAGAQSQSLLE